MGLLQVIALAYTLHGTLSMCPLEKRPYSKDSPITYAVKAPLAAVPGGTNIVEEAISVLQQKTCIRFQKAVGKVNILFSGLEHGAGQVYYACGADDATCNGIVNIATQSSKGPKLASLYVVIHEISHALGMIHAQNRLDRDNFYDASVYDSLPESEAYIKVQWRKFAENVDNFRIPLDLNSHVSASAVARLQNGSFAYVLKGLRPLTNRFRKDGGIRFTEYKLLNYYYDCPSVCTSKMECKNEGYQNSNKCDECICSPFFEGTNCETPKEVVDLDDQKNNVVAQFFHDYIGGMYSISDTTDSTWNFHRYRVLRAPEGRKIRVKLTDFTTLRDGYCDEDEYAAYTCKMGLVEIVDDFPLAPQTSGSRLCCKSDVGFEYTSNGNVLGLFAAAASQGLNVTLSFQLV